MLGSLAWASCQSLPHTDSLVLDALSQTAEDRSMAEESRVGEQAILVRTMGGRYKRDGNMVGLQQCR